MLFAISGSQGSGKSTVIQTLKQKGFPIVKRKTSRSILDEWGVTLSQVNNDREITVKFQDEILDRKIADDRAASEDISRIYFTERTLADFFTYALIAIGKDNEYSDWVNDYFKRCCDAQLMYSHNFYLNVLPLNVRTLFKTFRLLITFLNFDISYHCSHVALLKISSSSQPILCIIIK